MNFVKSIVFWDNYYRIDICLKYYIFVLKWGDIVYLGYMIFKGFMFLIKCNCLIGVKVWKKKWKF